MSFFYDETSPHLHLIGVPIRDGYKNELSSQVCKSQVFNKNKLIELQDKMRTFVAKRLTSPRLKGYFQVFIKDFSENVIFNYDDSNEINKAVKHIKQKNGKASKDSHKMFSEDN